MGAEQGDELAGWQGEEVARKDASILHRELRQQGTQGVKQGLHSVTRKYPVNQLTCHWCS